MIRMLEKHFRVIWAACALSGVVALLLVIRFLWLAPSFLAPPPGLQGDVRRALAAPSVSSRCPPPPVPEEQKMARAVYRASTSLQDAALRRPDEEYSWKVRAQVCVWSMYQACHDYYGVSCAYPGKHDHRSEVTEYCAVHVPLEAVTDGGPDGS